MRNGCGDVPYPIIKFQNRFFNNQPRYPQNIANNKLTKTNQRISECVARTNKYMYKASTSAAD